VAEYKFSVGKIKIGGGTAIAYCTGITISYDGGPVEFRGGDNRYPVWIELGAKSLEIRVESAKFDVNPTELDNTYVDVELQTGVEGGGLAGTITGCKVISYEVRQEQNAFVVSTMVIRKAVNP